MYEKIKKIISVLVLHIALDVKRKDIAWYSALRFSVNLRANQGLRQLALPRLLPSAESSLPKTSPTTDYHPLLIVKSTHKSKKIVLFMCTRAVIFNPKTKKKLSANVFIDSMSSNHTSLKILQPV